LRSRFEPEAKMAGMPAHLIAPIATIAAAFIAGGIAFLLAVVSKEQKTSEFRQQWIDALRNDIAELVGEAVLLNEVNDRLSGQKLSEGELGKIYKDYHPNLVKLRMLNARIDLRINPSKHRSFLAALKDVRSNAFSEEVDTRSDKIDRLVAASHQMLKTEWERVKRGERVFVATKIIAGAVTAAAFIGGSITVFQGLSAQAAVQAKSGTPSTKP
jgi:hypothetical protein